MFRVSIDNEELHERFKQHAARQRRTVKKQLEIALTVYLNEHGGDIDTLSASVLNSYGSGSSGGDSLAGSKAETPEKLTVSKAETPKLLAKKEPSSVRIGERTKAKNNEGAPNSAGSLNGASSQRMIAGDDVIEMSDEEKWNVINNGLSITEEAKLILTDFSNANSEPDEEESEEDWG